MLGSGLSTDLLEFVLKVITAITVVGVVLVGALVIFREEKPVDTWEAAIRRRKSLRYRLRGALGEIFGRGR
jgi:hypothetical protein